MSGRRRPALVAVLVLMTATASVPFRPDVLPEVVRIAFAIEQRGIVYAWGGGHAEEPGPSKGTCLGYTGKIRPCPAARTLGLDCSGFTRWVYALAHGADVLGPGNTDDHVRKMRRVRTARPGDLVFFGKITKKRVKTHHVGIYLGDGKMINAPETGAVVRIDPIGRIRDFVGFYRL
ncbi:C40 family peptidase [Nonomuraea sp. NPDC048916]|uniref:C40 family peptidase n=1 Tax=Nonomuraea sp. NPDC048916 TaxID=3154232 RepID=UPI0033E38444